MTTVGAQIPNTSNGTPSQYQTFSSSVLGWFKKQDGGHFVPFSNGFCSILELWLENRTNLSKSKQNGSHFVKKIRNLNHWTIEQLLTIWNHNAFGIRAPTVLLILFQVYGTFRWKCVKKFRPKVSPPTTKWLMNSSVSSLIPGKYMSPASHDFVYVNKWTSYISF